MVCAEDYKLFTIVGKKVETDESAEICKDMFWEVLVFQADIFGCICADYFS